jgi:hypothetical protein
MAGECHHASHVGSLLSVKEMYWLWLLGRCGYLEAVALKHRGHPADDMGLVLLKGVVFY